MASMIRAQWALILMLTAPAAVAQDYPTKPIRMIAPFTAGSGSDILARLIGPKLRDAWGQQVVVDNRGGAGGTIGAAIVATSTPDGHTLMLTSSGFAGSASIYPKLPYDSIKDFAPVTQVISNPLVVVVAPALGAKSLKELIAMARQKQGQLIYGSTGIGSGTHYGAELLRLSAKFDAVHVPYKGVTEALTDTIAGRVNFYLPPVLAVVPLVRDGRVVALAITGKERAPLLPDVPTPAEAGLPNFEYEGWYGMLAPGKVPRPVIEKISREMARILEQGEIRERIIGIGGTPKWTSPEAFGRMIRTEIETRAKVFRASGAKVE